MRSEVGANGAVIPPILDCKYSSVLYRKDCYDHLKAIIQSTNLKIASILAKFLRWSYRGTKWGEEIRTKF